MSDTINKEKLINFFHNAAIGYAIMKDIENHERCVLLIDMLASDVFDFYD